MAAVKDRNPQRTADGRPYTHPMAAVKDRRGEQEVNCPIGAREATEGVLLVRMAADGYPSPADGQCV